MLMITSKLKRVKLMRLFFTILLFPIKLLLVILNKIGEWSEKVCYFIDYRIYLPFENFISNKFDWDNIAREKYYKQHPEGKKG